MTTNRYTRRRADAPINEALGPAENLALSVQALTLHKHVIHHARGAGCDVDLIERGIEALCAKYGTSSLVVAMERLFSELEQFGLKQMRRPS